MSLSALVRASRHRTLARVFVMAGIAMIIGSTLSVVSSVFPTQASTLKPSSVGEPTDSAVTVRWVDQHDQLSDRRDPNYNTFKNLVFTVNQTQNLSHQGITVSWTGGVPTSQQKYNTNFMQAMQCWDAIADPTHCQWGAPAGSISDLTGYQAQTRVIETTLDPGQAAQLPSSYCMDSPTCSTNAVPYVTPDGISTFATGDLYSSATSNEVSAVSTAADGSGMFNFEVQTGLDAPHLACGQSDANGSPRECTLVIVPRGSLDPNGRVPSDAQGRVSGSPLTYSAWRNRIEIPLTFLSIGESCAMGKSEVRVVGSDVASRAMNSWQTAMCGSGQTFGFSRISDDEARNQITGDFLGSSHMAFVASALAATNPKAKQLDYAPIAQSALVIAYNIDYSLYRTSPLYSQKDGTKVHNLRLNQRLVAKLLTQSYKVDTPSNGVGVAALVRNPASLVTDPEFLGLNPEFRDFTPVTPQGLMVAFGNADAYAHVWEWIRSNSEAKGFLQGAADPWGMRVNPAYKALGLTDGEASVSFPKADLTTHTDARDVPSYGSLDMRPYFNNLDETGLRTLRADGNVKTTWDPFKLPAPGAYVSGGPQPAGQRFSISITDLATAYQYGLDVASLQSGVTGNFVEPTVESITKAIGNQSPTDVAGVSGTDWAKKVRDAYPLTEVAYAAVNICKATKAERLAYVSLIDYAGTDGQVLGHQAGSLPFGYVPLTAKQKTVLEKTLRDIRNPADIDTRCAADNTETSSEQGIEQSTFTPIELPLNFDTGIMSDAPTAAKKKLFIAKPIYGAGSTSDDMPTFTRTLTAGGYVLGIPLLLAGLLMQRRSRREVITVL